MRILVVEDERDPEGVYVETTTEVVNAHLPEEPQAPAKLSKAEEDALDDDDATPGWRR